MKWWQRFKRWASKRFVAEGHEAEVYGNYDDYLDGLLTRYQYEVRARDAFEREQYRLTHPEGMAASIDTQDGPVIWVGGDGDSYVCDDCHGVDGQHDLTVEH